MLNLTTIINLDSITLRIIDEPSRGPYNRISSASMRIKIPYNGEKEKEQLEEQDRM
jgi:hypothetical protein